MRAFAFSKSVYAKLSPDMFKGGSVKDFVFLSINLPIVCQNALLPVFVFIIKSSNVFHVIFSGIFFQVINVISLVFITFSVCRIV